MSARWLPWLRGTVPAARQPPRADGQDADPGRPYRWIAEHVHGRSFLDIGALDRGDAIAAALAAGARTATKAGVPMPGEPPWQAFDAWCAQHEVHGHGRARLDLLDLPGDCTALAHDVVHCTGVLPHVPDLHQVACNLRRVTREVLVLTSMVVPARVENAAGVQVFPPDRAVFVPVMTAPTRAVMAAHCDALGVVAAGVNAPLDGCGAWHWPDGRVNRGPWWWLMSPAYLCGVLAMVGFEVVDGGWTWDRRAYSVVARRVG